MPRVRNLIPALQNADRLVAIWNNPDAHQPIALYTHFTTIRKDIFNDFSRYGKLYCNAKQQIFGWDYSGKHHHSINASSSHLTCSIGISKETEFKYILDSLIWIRRTNDDIPSNERIF